MTNKQLEIPRQLQGKIIAPLNVELPTGKISVNQLFAADTFVALSTDDREKDRLDVGREAIVHFRKTPLSLLEVLTHRPAAGHCLVKDLSQSGLAVLFDQIAYPCEELSVYLNGREIRATVQRCLKLGPRCFEIGCAITNVSTAIH